MHSRYRSSVTVLLVLGLLAIPAVAAGTSVAAGVTQAMLDTTGFEERTIALVINAQGEIVGLTSDCASDVIQAIAWDAAGTPRRLPTPEGWTSVALDINDRGEIAGATIDEAGYSTPVVWSVGGMARLPIEDAEYGVALALNNHGNVIGSLASEDASEVYVLWTGEEIIDITAPESFIWTQLNDINAARVVVGSAGTSSLDTTSGYVARREFRLVTGSRIPRRRVDRLGNQRDRHHSRDVRG